MIVYGFGLSPEGLSQQEMNLHWNTCNDEAPQNSLSHWVLHFTFTWCWFFFFFILCYFFCHNCHFGSLLVSFWISSVKLWWWLFCASWVPPAVEEATARGKHNAFSLLSFVWFPLHVNCTDCKLKPHKRFKKTKKQFKFKKFNWPF